jgi:hypothetical protein
VEGSGVKEMVLGCLDVIWMGIVLGRSRRDMEGSSIRAVSM